jgi:hypothetical protein
LTVGLPRAARGQRRRELLVETIDGVAAGSSRWRPALAAAGARDDYRGLVVRGSTSTAAPPTEPDPADDPDDGDDAPA